MLAKNVWLVVVNIQLLFIVLKAEHNRHQFTVRLKIKSPLFQIPLLEPVVRCCTLTSDSKRRQQCDVLHLDVVGVPE